MSDKRLDGQSVLIIGGSRGIGLAGAIQAADEGATVYASHMRDLPEEARAHEDRINFVRSDATDWSAQRSLVNRVVAETGKLDVVNANAAVSWLTERKNPDYETHLDHCLALNVKGVVAVTLHFVNYLEDTGRDGAVIIPSSIAVTETLGGFRGGGEDWIGAGSIGPYTLTRHAVEGHAQELARTLNTADHPTRLIVVCPRYGCVETDMLRSEAEQLVPQANKYHGDGWTPDKVYDGFLPGFNKAERNLKPEEAASFTWDLLAYARAEGRSMIGIEQPGAAKPLDYDWKADCAAPPEQPE